MYLLREDDGGYWFIWVLFWITLLFLCMQTAYKYLRRLQYKIINNVFLELIILMLPYVLLWILGYYKAIPIQIENIFAISKILKYYPCFIVGYFLGKYLIFDKIVRNPISVFILILAFILIEYKNFTGFRGYAYISISLILCLAIYAVLRTNSDKIQKYFPQLSYVGQRSLDIYLFHYFFIGVFSNGEMSPLPLYIGYWFWELVVQLVMAGILICACIFVGNIIRSNKYAAFLFLGEKLNKI
jgi:hypothetical protein